MPTTASLPPRLHGLTPLAVQQVVATANALEAGRIDEAETRLGAALAAFPAHAEVLRLWAGIRSQRGDHETAIRAILDAAAQRPTDALYQNTLGTVLAEAGDYDGAIAALRRCCELQPGLALAWFNLGVLLTRCVRHDEAVVAPARQAVALAPTHVQARALLADMLRVANHPDEAAAEYRRILAERPCTGIAWWGLADLKTMRFDVGDIARMQAALQDATATDDDRIATGFALAKALDDAGDYADSLAALEQANATARRRRRWDAAGFDALMAAIRSAYAAAAASHVPAGSLGSEAIFIVSLPRSGSTLIEQILASHSGVEGAGELADLPLLIAEESRRRQQPYPRWVGAMREEDWQGLGHRYLERTAHWRRRRPRFTDKLPNNWYYIDAIRRMLPGARIITVRRDPLETCFSCYRQFLYNNEYTRSFADLAGFWRAFDRAVRDGVARHPARVHESVYENLVANPGATIRELLDFLGLPFEQACVDFHLTERDVRSPSAMQVRQPLRRDTARTARYGALLDPLRRELGLPAFDRRQGATAGAWSVE